MAKSAQERVENWAARMPCEAMSDCAKRALGPRGKLSIAGTNAHISATEALCERAEMVRPLLGSSGVRTILFPSYLAFARQLYRLQIQGCTVNGGPGSPRYLQAQTLAAKWEREGLDPAVLSGMLKLFRERVATEKRGTSPVLLSCRATRQTRLTQGKRVRDSGMPDPGPGRSGSAAGFRSSGAADMREPCAKSCSPVLANQLLLYPARGLRLSLEAEVRLATPERRGRSDV